MTTKRYSINGTNFYPTTVEVTEEPIRDTQRMLDGTLRIWHRAFKNTWNLTWTNLPESYVAAIRALYRTTATMTLINENDESFTVVTTAFNTTLSADNISLSGIIHYDVTLELQEE